MFVSYVCCVLCRTASATSWSLVQRSPVGVCDLESSETRRPPDLSCCGTKKKTFCCTYETPAFNTKAQVIISMQKMTIQSILFQQNVLIFQYCVYGTNTVPQRTNNIKNNIKRNTTVNSCTDKEHYNSNTHSLAVWPLKNLGPNTIAAHSSVSFAFYLQRLTSSTRRSFSTSSSHLDLRFPHFRSTFWLAFEDFLTHPCLIHSERKLQPLQLLPFNIRYSLSPSNAAITLSGCF